MIHNKTFLAMMNRLPLKGQRLGWVDFLRNHSSDSEQQDVGGVVLDAPIEEANIMTSLIDVDTIGGRELAPARRTTGRESIDMHRPVIDIDHGVRVVESSTPGHNHLFIDVMMPWEDVVKLLEVMAEIGLVQPGYVNASKARGFTAVRLPWITKEQLTDSEVNGQ